MVSVACLWVWTRLKMARKHPSRWAGTVALLLMVNEALLGAFLVLFEHVAPWLKLEQLEQLEQPEPWLPWETRCFRLHLSVLPSRGISRPKAITSCDCAFCIRLQQS